jgi:hypothetical protein
MNIFQKKIFEKIFEYCLPYSRGSQQDYCNIMYMLQFYCHFPITGPLSSADMAEKWYFLPPLARRLPVACPALAQRLFGASHHLPGTCPTLVWLLPVTCPSLAWHLPDA